MIRQNQTKNGTIISKHQGLYNVSIGGKYTFIKVPSIYPNHQYHKGRSVILAFIKTDNPVIISPGYKTQWAGNAFKPLYPYKFQHCNPLKTNWCKGLNKTTYNLPSGTGAIHHQFDTNEEIGFSDQQFIYGLANLYQLTPGGNVTTYKKTPYIQSQGHYPWNADFLHNKGVYKYTGSLTYRKLDYQNDTVTNVQHVSNDPLPLPPHYLWANNESQDYNEFYDINNNKLFQLGPADAYTYGTPKAVTFTDYYSIRWIPGEDNFQFYVNKDGPHTYTYSYPYGYPDYYRCFGDIIRWKRTWDGTNYEISIGPHPAGEYESAGTYLDESITFPISNNQQEYKFGQTAGTLSWHAFDWKMNKTRTGVLSLAEISSNPTIEIETGFLTDDHLYYCKFYDTTDEVRGVIGVDLVNDCLYYCWKRTQPSPIPTILRLFPYGSYIATGESSWMLIR